MSTVRDEIIETLGYYGADEVFNLRTMKSEYVDHRDELIDALVAVVEKRMPESSEHVEWGVFGGPGRQTSRIETHCTDPGGVHRQYDESLARYDTSGRPEDLYRRTVTTYKDSKTEWEHP